MRGLRMPMKDWERLGRFVVSRLERQMRLRGLALGAAQIANYAAAAGFAGQDLVTAVAVALAESSGNPSAYNPEGSYGLWQIYVPAHPEYAGAAQSGALNDPATNAAAAFAIYSAAGNSFRPWTTFKTGAYLQYMTPAQSGVLADARGDAPDPSQTFAQISDGGDSASSATGLAIGGAIIGGILLADWIFK